MERFMIEEQIVENKNKELLIALRKVGMIGLISVLGGILYGFLLVSLGGQDYNNAASSMEYVIAIVQDIGVFKIMYGSVVAQMITGILYGVAWQKIRFTRKDWSTFNFKNYIILTSLMILTYTVVSLLNIVFPDNPYARAIFHLRALFLGIRLETSFLKSLVLFHGFVFPTLETLLIQGVILKSVQSFSRPMAILVSAIIASSFYLHPVVALQLFMVAMVISIFQSKRPSLLTVLIANITFHLLALNSIVPLFTDEAFFGMLLAWIVLLIFGFIWVIKKRKGIISFVKENALHKEDIQMLFRARAFVIFMFIYLIGSIITNLAYN